MAGIVPDAGKEIILQIAFVGATAFGTTQIHLYVNDYTPDSGSTLVSFTECTDPSYAPIDWTTADWSVSSPGGTATLDGSQQTYTLDGPVTIYGYYATETTPTNVLFAERFSSPVVVDASGNILKLTPHVILSSP